MNKKQQRLLFLSVFLLVPAVQAHYTYRICHYTCKPAFEKQNEQQSYVEQARMWYRNIVGKQHDSFDTLFHDTATKYHGSSYTYQQAYTASTFDMESALVEQVQRFFDRCPNQRLLVVDLRHTQTTRLKSFLGKSSCGMYAHLQAYIQGKQQKKMKKGLAALVREVNPACIMYLVESSEPGKNNIMTEKDVLHCSARFGLPTVLYGIARYGATTMVPATQERIHVLNNLEKQADRAVAMLNNKRTISGVFFVSFLGSLAFHYLVGGYFLMCIGFSSFCEAITPGLMLGIAFAATTLLTHNIWFKGGYFAGIICSLWLSALHFSEIEFLMYSLLFLYGFFYYTVPKRPRQYYLEYADCVQ